MSRPIIPAHISRMANELAAADDSVFAEAFRRAWPEAVATALAEAAVVPLDTAGARP